MLEPVGSFRLPSSLDSGAEFEDDPQARTGGSGAVLGFELGFGLRSTTTTSAGSRAGSFGDVVGTNTGAEERNALTALSTRSILGLGGSGYRAVPFDGRGGFVADDRDGVAMRLWDQS